MRWHPTGTRLPSVKSPKKSWKIIKNQKNSVKIIGKIGMETSKTDKKQKNSVKIGMETSKSAQIDIQKSRKIKNKSEKIVKSSK